MKGPGAAIADLVDELRARYGEIELDLDEADGRRFVDAYLEAEGSPTGEDLQAAIFSPHTGTPALHDRAGPHAQGEGRPALARFGRHAFRRRRAAGDLGQASRRGWTAVLVERIAGLPPEIRRTLEIASVQGSVFAAEAVALVQGKSADVLIGRLSGSLLAPYRLVHAHRVETGEGWRMSLYRFDNAFVRDLLYGRLDPVLKARWHEATALALEKLLGEDRGRMPGRLARHFQLGGDTEKAVAYLERAGHCALSGSAYLTAHGIPRKRWRCSGGWTGRRTAGTKSCGSTWRSTGPSGWPRGGMLRSGVRR